MVKRLESEPIPVVLPESQKNFLEAIEHGVYVISGRKYREKQGLKQATVARRQDIDPSIVALWEHGTRPTPADRLPGYVAALVVTTDDQFIELFHHATVKTDPTKTPETGMPLVVYLQTIGFNSPLLDQLDRYNQANNSEPRDTHAADNTQAMPGVSKRNGSSRDAQPLIEQIRIKASLAFGGQHLSFSNGVEQVAKVEEVVETPEPEVKKTPKLVFDSDRLKPELTLAALRLRMCTDHTTWGNNNTNPDELLTMIQEHCALGEKFLIGRTVTETIFRLIISTTQDYTVEDLAQQAQVLSGRVVTPELVRKLVPTFRILPISLREQTITGD